MLKHCSKEHAELRKGLQTNILVEGTEDKPVLPP